MNRALTARQEAEAIEQFGDDLAKLNNEFDRLCERMSSHAINAINGVPLQDELCTIWAAFQEIGARLSSECDAAEEADDCRRDNPLEPDFRRLGQ